MTSLIFFGDASDDLESLKLKHPALQFRSIKQTHSNIVVQAQSEMIEADAQWSVKPGEALCVRTADCVPVLLSSRDHTIVAAVHAGWRGIASSIIQKTISSLQAQGADVSKLCAAIGPHIRVASFEVGTDVSQQLEELYSKLPQLGPVTSAHPDLKKRYVNLERIAQAQLQAAGVRAENIISSGADTLKTRTLHSFRRDGAKAGRQVSFVALVTD